MRNTAAAYGYTLSTAATIRGPHFCLGASLARLEGRVALEETLVRFPQWEVDQDRAVRLHTSTVRGYEKLPITV